MRVISLRSAIRSTGGDVSRGVRGGRGLGRLLSVLQPLSVLIRMGMGVRVRVRVRVGVRVARSGPTAGTTTHQVHEHEAGQRHEVRSIHRQVGGAAQQLLRLRQHHADAQVEENPARCRRCDGAKPAIAVQRRAAQRRDPAGETDTKQREQKTELGLGELRHEAAERPGVFAVDGRQRACLCVLVMRELLVAFVGMRVGMRVRVTSVCRDQRQRQVESWPQIHPRQTKPRRKQEQPKNAERAPRLCKRAPKPHSLALATQRRT
mmetsp:Transcript_5987/g.23252  ORF Transcript_5987/g.23252 Transcript_5987/m.23252 type:complete len:263 (-) Transcript_5987:87-875(-)